MSQVFISSFGLSGVNNLVKFSQIIDERIGLELTGLSRSDLAKVLGQLKVQKLSMHNYVNYESPFVFNLASLDDEILESSLRMAKQNIEKVHQIRGSIYSFHAGFYLDPNPLQLGSVIDCGTHLDSRVLDRHKAQFRDSLNELAGFADSRDVSLFVENNVLTKPNLDLWQQNRLAMVDPAGIREFGDILKETNTGLLLDVAHWKVSGRTLGYDLFEIIPILEDFQFGLHVSDNDGLQDTNDEFKSDSWFWPLLRELTPEFVTVEVYRVSGQRLNELALECWSELNG